MEWKIGVEESGSSGRQGARLRTASRSDMRRRYARRLVSPDAMSAVTAE